MLKKVIQNNPQGIVFRALEFTKKTHVGQTRKTGEPYYIHLEAVAETLLEWNMDEACIVAGLLHDVLEDTETTYEMLKKEFSIEVADLVNQVTKFGIVKYRGVEAQAELLRKMMLSLAKDVRVVLIKFADRLHNMKTLGALPPQKQKRIALETAEIYAPLAYRLGMHRLSGTFEDLAFPFIQPKEYKKLLKAVGQKYGEREAYLERVKPVLYEALAKNNIEAVDITFRAKRLFSLYKKLYKYDMDLDRIYDLVAFRIVVKNIEDCYAVLGIVHSLWKPLPGRIKDYIAMAKPNGYQSLHTTVFCLDNKITEFQIRTDNMHTQAENGIAAHWLYKTQPNRRQDINELIKESEWVSRVKEFNENEKAENFIEILKTDSFLNRIYVVTPQGEVRDLPYGSTPIDFAYRIHSDLGNEAVRARVNGKIVPLNYCLESGDIVEIMRQKGKLPSEDWLLFIKTHSAKDHIRQTLNKKGKRLKNRVRG